MAIARLETLSATLDDLHESLDARLTEAANLLCVAEDAEFLVETNKAKAGRIFQLIEDTRALRELVAERLEELRDLRDQMMALLPPTQ